MFSGCRLEFQPTYKLIYRKVCGLHTLHYFGAPVFTVAISFNMKVLIDHSCHEVVNSTQTDSTQTVHSSYGHVSFLWYYYISLCSDLSSDLYCFSSQVRVNFVIPLFLVALAVWLAYVHYT